MSRLAVTMTLLLPLAAAAQSVITEHVLDDFDPPRDSWKSPLISFERDPRRGGVAVLSIPANSKVTAVPLDLGDWAPRAFDFDELRFEYTISNPQVWFGCKIMDRPLADGYQATWQLQIPESADRAWHTAAIDLRNPMFRWGENPVNFRALHFRVDNQTPSPVVIRLSRLRYVRKGITLTQAGHGVGWTSPRSGHLDLRISSRLDQPADIPIRTAASLAGLSFRGLPERLQVPAGGTTPLRVAFELPEGTPELTPFDLSVQLLGDGGLAAESVTAETASPMMRPLPTPALLCHADRRADIRRRVRDREPARLWWESHRKAMDGWLKADIAYPPRGAQWWHWYSCKKCGSSLKTKTPTLHICPTCKAEYSGYPYDDVVLSRDHDRLAHAVRDLGVAYFISGDRRYADKARDILLGYAERYLGYPLHDIHGKPTKGGGHVHPQTLDEAIWLISIVQGTDAIRDTLSDDDFRAIGEKMILPAAYHIKNHQWGIHNICCWHTSAYGLAGLLYNRGDLIRAAIFGPNGFLRQVEKGVTSDGQWYERAWGYHFYTTSALEPIAIAIRLNGLAPIPDRFKLLFDGPLKFLTPTSELPAFHDTARVRFDPRANATHYELAYAFWGDPLHGAVLAQTDRRNLYATLFGRDTIESASKPASSENYLETGIAVLRSQTPGTAAATMPPNYVAIDYGEHGGGHGHPDKLNFVLWAHGTLLAEDPGCIAYGNPAHQGWYRQTISHNTLVVDGKSQTPATGRCLAYAAFPDASLIVADAGPIYPNLKAGRALALIGDTLLDLLWATDTTGNPRRLEYAFHSRGERTDTPPATQQPCDAPRGDGYAWAKNWQSLPHDGTATAVWRHQDVRLSMAHASSAPGTLLSASGQGNPPTVRFSLVLNRVDAPSAVFASAFAFSDPAKPAPQLSVEMLPSDAGVAAIRAQANGDTYLLLVSQDGSRRRLAAAGVACDARAALFRLDGQSLKLVLADGD